MLQKINVVIAMSPLAKLKRIQNCRRKKEELQVPRELEEVLADEIVPTRLKDV